MSSLFKAIGSFFKKLWKALRKILAILLIIIAIIVIIWACIFCPPLGGVLFGVAFSSATAAFAFGCVLLVGAFLVDTETAKEVVGKVGEAAGDAAESVGKAAGDIIDGAVSGIFGSSTLMWLAVGVGAYFLLSGSKGSDTPKTKAVSADPIVGPSPTKRTQTQARNNKSDMAALLA